VLTCCTSQNIISKYEPLQKWNTELRIQIKFARKNNSNSEKVTNKHTIGGIHEAINHQFITERRVKQSAE